MRVPLCIGLAVVLVVSGVNAHLEQDDGRATVPEAHTRTARRVNKAAVATTTASSPTSRASPESTASETSTPQPTGRTSAAPSGRACKEIRSSQYIRRRRAVLQTQFTAVVGGVKATLSEFPYMVALGYARGNTNDNTSDLVWGCGGSLISQRYVLTAAHCITDARTQNLRPVVVRAGVNTLNRGPRAAGDYSVESVTLHPKFQSTLKYFDLALLRTERPVTFSGAVQPVCLPAATDRVNNSTRLFAAGWGATDPAGYVMSADLKKAELRFVSLDDCKQLIPSTKGIPRGLGNDMMCVADPKGESDTCRGDSGGPLVSRTSNGDTLVGVTSFGGNPCAGRTPGVYARTAPELPWIESIVWP